MDEHGSPQEISRIERIRAELAEFYTAEQLQPDDITAAELAEAFGISCGHAQTKMKQIAKVRPGQYEYLQVRKGRTIQSVLRPRKAG